MEQHGVLDHLRAQLGQAEFGGLGQAIRAGGGGEAGVLGQQLVQGRHAAGELGQVDAERPEIRADTVDERAERARRSPVGGTECDELTGQFRAAALLDVPARDQAAHRMADEDDPGVVVGVALRAPAVKRGFHDRFQALPVVPVGQPPVVRNEKQVSGRRAVIWHGLAVTEPAEPGDQPVISLA